MTKRVGLRFIIATGLMTYATAAFSGAWTLEEGKGDLILTGTAMQASNLFSTGSALQPTARYSKDEAQALFEYGVSNWFTAMFAPSLQHVDIAAPYNADRSGLGYTDVGG